MKLNITQPKNISIEEIFGKPDNNSFHNTANFNFYLTITLIIMCSLILTIVILIIVIIKKKQTPVRDNSYTVVLKIINDLIITFNYGMG